jgi:hypothetical protein
VELKDTKYFKVSEILRSSTAKKHNIDNTPTDETIIDNINYTLNRLNEIREQYGKPIYINSGYRCDELNVLVGGVKDSKHRLGLAVDLRWDTDLIDFLIENCSFDKLIREKAGKSKWIHLQFCRNIYKERRLVFNISK